MTQLYSPSVIQIFFRLVHFAVVPGPATPALPSLSAGRQPHNDPIVITTHGGMSRKTSRRAIIAQGKAAGWQSGSTRSTVIWPSRGPRTPDAISTTPGNAVRSQIAPTLFGP